MYKMILRCRVDGATVCREHLQPNDFLVARVTSRVVLIGCFYGSTEKLYLLRRTFFFQAIKKPAFSDNSTIIRSDIRTAII